ncbi:MAG: aldehyde ferredoxin oxidoreductase family protein [Bacillota bacterium]|nr:aldehyde ferredoxin oxidoreductase family protein [Bacillota bacterium]MDW7684495.1 aldehyde ferredoxin oxidoreductase family protein [Bacillota bacterium]
MIYGYAGKILRVDLSHGQIKEEELSPTLVEEYMGGRGFVAKTLYDELPPDTAPFDEDNLIVIAMGPLSGHFLPASGKTHFGTKSPATDGFGDSNMGGHFGVAMKYAGYDMMVIKGKAQKPSYLYIEDGHVEIRPADKYWGKGALTTEKMLKDDLGEEFQIATIGPAGENRVRYACISHDFGRQAGRTGVAAVLGSKNIKAIAIKGTGSIPVHDTEEVLTRGKEVFSAVRKMPGFKGWTPQGTAGITDWCNEVGACPTRNFQTSYFEHYKQINGEAVLEHVKITDKGCFGCPTPCGKYGYAKTASGSAFVEGPEYETIALLGSNCSLAKIEEVAYANYVCDELGVDTISAGVVMSWAMECYEKGIFSKELLGREIHFGELDSIVYLLEKIAHREGLGNLLAEGVKIAAEKTGQGSEKFAIHVKGLEWTGYECRNAPGMMLGYITADVGAHHSRCWVLGNDVAGSENVGSVHDLISGGKNSNTLPKAKVKGVSPMVINSQHTRPAFDILGICRLQYMELGLETKYYEEMYEAITGKKLVWSELLKISEKIWNLNRCFNIREIDGYGRSSDYPPPRFYEEPIPSGPNKGHLIVLDEIDSLLDEFYDARGWDSNGVPTETTLRRLGLADTIDTVNSKRSSGAGSVK